MGQSAHARGGHDLRAFLCGLAVVVLLIAAIVIEWSGDASLSERHHSHHDTYFVPRSLTTSLVLMMVFVGVLGIVIGWLCLVGVFKADARVVFAFFFTFLVVSFLMWGAIRRYRVSTYEDRLRVTPFIGRTETIMYTDIDRMTWSRRSFGTSYRNLHIYAGTRKVFLWGTIDLEQILARINRFDVLEGSDTGPAPRP